MTTENDVPEPTMASAWAALQKDLARHKESVTPGHRQAFKNGAARIATMPEPPVSDTAAVQVLAPWAAFCREAHPDWDELHSDCVLAGGLSALSILRAGIPARALIADISEFGTVS